MDHTVNPGGRACGRCAPRALLRRFTLLKVKKSEEPPRPSSAIRARSLDRMSLIEPEFRSAEEGEVNCRERLGGLFRYYSRDAA